MNYDLFVALGFVIAAAVAPVAAWRPSRPIAPVATVLFVLFVIFYWNYAIGLNGPRHDTLYSYKMWFTLLRQWVDNGVALGWNPYTGGGQPFSLYNNIYPFEPPIIASFLSGLFGIVLSKSAFFNVTWMFCYLQICSWTLLLLLLVYGDSRVALLGFSSLLFGGLFFVDNLQPTGFSTLFFLPSILFFTAHAFRTKQRIGLLLAALELGAASNFYLPSYLLTALLALLVFYILFMAREKRDFSAEFAFLKSPSLLFAVVLLMALAVAPMAYSYFEMSDYVSPSRGFSVRGEVTAENAGFQEPIYAPLKYYRILFDPVYNLYSFFDWPYHSHTSFYIGSGAFMLFLIGLFLGRAIWLSLAVGFLVVMGMGSETPIWGLLVDNLPIMNMMRHGMAFARIASFLVILAAPAGALALVSTEISAKRKLAAIACAGLVVIVFSRYGDMWNLLIIMSSVTMYILAAVAARRENFKSAALFLTLILLLHVVDLGVSAARQGIRMSMATELPERPFNYPANWVATSPYVANLPFDFFPALYKDIAWFNSKPDFMFLLQKDFASFSRKAGLIGSRKSGDVFTLATANPACGADASVLVSLEKMTGIIDLQKKTGFGFINRDACEVGDGIGVIARHSSVNPNSVSVSVDARVDANLLRFENYHRGWKAFVDGVPAEITRVYPNFQSVRIQKGAHEIDFIFNSPYNTLVMGWCGLMAVSWFIKLIWLWRRKDDDNAMSRNFANGPHPW